MRRIAVASFFLLFSCGSNDSRAPVTKFPDGNLSTVSSFNANLSSSESFSNYVTEYTAIHALGAKGVQTAAPWASLNPTGTTYDLTIITNPFFGLSNLASYGYEVIFLNIPIVSIASRTMPSDISALPFDDPTVKIRFHALIDAIKDQLISQVKYVSLGNEVDAYFSTHPAEWTSYNNLVLDARSYLKSIKPNITVGVTTTFDGATSKYVSQIQSLNAGMDAVMLTYYPTSTSFTVRDPSTVTGDVSRMISTSQGKPLIIQEWGYPSSTVLGSSETRQAEFFYNSFVELEKQGVARFPFVSFFKYRDWSTAYVQNITGQNPGQPFFEFMSSLGLKKNDGTSKPAFSVIEGWINP